MKRRSGFTLIELMIVIVIIIILVGLLTPVLVGTVRKARQANVQSEISALESAIADFTATFGTAPPSHIDFHLYENPNGTSPSPTGSYLHPATQSKLRRLWPNIDLTDTPTASEPPVPTLLVDVLQKNPENQRKLDGPACLVFFLGGVVIDVNGIPMGFSTNPRTPLYVIAGGRRVGPFYEFHQPRLVDNDPTPFNGYEGYLDPLPDQNLPYLYIARDQYAKAVADGKTVYKLTSSQFAKPNSYQIISPGYDRDYGVGGVYNEKAGTIVNGTLDTTKDHDNITNFGSGPLVN